MLKIWLQVLVWIVVMAALVFWRAGTLDYAGGWAFAGIFAAASVMWFYGSPVARICVVDAAVRHRLIPSVW